MAESQSPIICVTCHREFPDDLDADNSPRYFAHEGALRCDVLRGSSTRGPEDLRHHF
jgi:hypothetical protein